MWFCVTHTYINLTGITRNEQIYKIRNNPLKPSLNVLSFFICQSWWRHQLTVLNSVNLFSLFRPRSYKWANKTHISQIMTKVTTAKLLSSQLWRMWRQWECGWTPMESILPNFDFFVFQIFVVKLECSQHKEILSVLWNGQA